MATAHTVLGEIPPSQMGITLSHEHLLLSWGSARYDRADEYKLEPLVKEICDDLGAAARDHGVKTIVDVTTADMGRDMELMADVSRRTGVNVIAATGFYRQMAGIPLYFTMASLEQAEATMLHDIQHGVGPNRVKCGVIKLAISQSKLLPAEEKVFRAAGRVQKKTGVPIVMHTTGWEQTEGGSGPRAAAELVTSEGGDPAHIQISHCETARGNLPLLIELANRGFTLAFDRVGRTLESDQSQATAVGGLVVGGYAHRVTLSHDSVGAWFPAIPGTYRKSGFSGAHKQFIPLLLKGGVSDKQIHQILVENPRQLFAY